MGTNQAYVELATGLNYAGPSGWLASKAEVDAYPGGAVFQYAQHKVIFANNLNTAGAIDLQTPDGKELRSTVIGLSYYSLASAKTVLIAQAQDSQGQIVNGNQVLYTNAFQGVRANVRYACTKAGLSQTIVFLAQPPPPEAFGLSSASCVLQVLTEFTAAPTPVIRTWPARPAAGAPLPDDSLDFGVMKMVRGKAFMSGTNSPSAPVMKQWTTQGGRTVLIESISLSAISNQLAQLPTLSLNRPKASKDSPLYALSSKRLLPAPAPGTTRDRTRKMEFAGAPAPERGLAADYEIINTDQSGYTFRGDTTYYISAAVNLSGATTFEGGAVLKYASGASLNVYDPATITDLATEYRPVIFTTKDDNAPGQTISGSSGSPAGEYYANPALAYAGPNSGSGTLSLSNLRILHAHQGLSVTGVSMTATLSDSQIVDCWYGVEMPGQGALNLLNSLLARDGLPDGGALLNGLAYVNVYSVNSTLSGNPAGSAMATGDASSVHLYFTNCVLANLSSFYAPNENDVSGDPNGFYNDTPQYFPNAHVPPSVVSGGAFLGEGGAAFYLADPALQDAGTLDIDQGLLAELRKRTTAGPEEYLNTSISYPTTLTPLGLGDTGAPDLGYHYPILDYVFGNVTLTSTLTLQDGVVVGLRGIPALTTGNGANVDATAQGACQAGLMNRIVSTENVQEESGAGNEFLESGGSADASRQFQFQSTEFSIGQGELGHVMWTTTAMPPFTTVSFQDCVLRDVQCEATLDPPALEGGQTVSLVNNRLPESQLSFVSTPTYNPTGNPVTLNLYNNLLRGGSLDLNYQTGGAPMPNWYVKDNLFDGCSQSLSGDSYGEALVLRSNNGFTSGTADSLGGAGDLTGLTADYEAGPLGDFYYPASGANDLASLIDAGSRSASAAGLDAYTTQVSQTPDSGTVDIGYHYPIAPILGPSAFWDVTDITDPNNPVYLGLLQAPFGDPGYDPNPCDEWPEPPEITAWYDWTTWQLDKTIYVPAGATVEYSVRIDNYCDLYVNGNPLPEISGGCSAWTDLAPLPYINAGANNTLRAVIWGDRDGVDYFSMVMTAAGCFSP